MNKAKKLFTKAKVREKGGAIGSARYDFQKDWGICEIIRRHEAGEDYVVFFDYHEDLVIGNNENNPSTFEFYQIKTQSKLGWTLTQILRRSSTKSGQKLSILGKLYTNKIKFKKAAAGLYFVSNVPVKVGIKNGSTSFSCLGCIHLHKTDLAKIKKALAAEHNLKKEPSIEKLLFFQKTDLSVLDSKGHTKGKLIEFLARYIPKSKANANSVYQALFDEIRNKTNQVDTAKDFNELKSLKSIPRSFVIRMLDQLSNSRDPDEIWGRVEGYLLSSGCPPTLVRSIKTSWIQIEIKIMGRNNLALDAAIQSITLWYLKKEQSNSNISLMDWIELIKNEKSALNNCNTLSDSDVQAILLKVIFDEKSEQYPQTSKNPA